VTKIVLATFGSLGDLHPYIGIGLELQKRGYHVVIASCGGYRGTVEGEGIEFASLRPEVPMEDHEMLRKIMDGKNGPRYLFCDVIIPSLRDTHADLLAACLDADAIVGHPLLFSVPLVARLQGIPWAYVALAPIMFLSAYDPPLSVPGLTVLRKGGPGFLSLLFRLVRFGLDMLFGEVRKLSKELGMYPCQRSPIGADQFSPRLNLALFSTVIGAPQVDWPQNTVATGFVFHDRTASTPGLSRELLEFINAGEPPVVFTLGSAAVNNAGQFYQQSADAAIKIGKRAVLLVGRGTGNAPVGPLPASIFVAEYASFSELFPLCAVIVHQGGVGTTAQALHAGKPMLVMPYAFDQPDNALRMVRLGVARCIKREKYNVESVSKLLLELISGPYASKAQAISRLIKMENGTSAACDAIEFKLLRKINRAHCAH
jgi:UDP:flavonoid glycosyltransferase YjiC (YdhE family)